ncbi:MAG: 50S ribosomal protein L11 methyltransferase, partial [Methanobacterium paludis]|nr:50S ribosomal protein L11 methyltransferase [Methanobacterium paludis]
VKGVLKGDLRKTVGIRDSNSSPNVYKLLAGCDMRCDIVQTQYGSICIYKHQGEIHIEFSKPVSPKVTILNKALNQYATPTVLDCTCGPGTLGITCLKAGAEKVVFNDLWYPAARTTALNLEINGFSVDIFDKKEGLIASGKNFDVYCADVKDLKNILDEKFDICLVDTFPGVGIDKFKIAVKELCNQVVVI